VQPGLPPVAPLPIFENLCRFNYRRLPDFLRFVEGILTMSTTSTVSVSTQTPPVLNLRPRSGFANTPFIQELMERGMAYISAGFAVHFCGPSGSGKTTLAMHLANLLGQPLMLLTGDDQFGTSDLVGGQFGYKRRKVVDNFVHSVIKTEEDMTQRWSDSRLTIACREGYTLVYDEFTRSRPEANNVLLSVLEEKLMVLPVARAGNSYLKVHPNFSAIFTSNPEDYAGVHKTQDALRDRMVTIYLDYFDKPTETLITSNRSGLDLEQAERIVSLVRAFREQSTGELKPTVRAAIMIAKVVELQKFEVSAHDARFLQVCFDVLGGGLLRSSGLHPLERLKHRQIIAQLAEEFCKD
jgi:gas vesicle protein GvpN